MKKRLFTGIIIGAAAIGIAGCGGAGTGTGGSTEATTTSAAETTSAKETKESTTATTTTQKATETTTSETTTKATESETATQETSSGEYKLVVNKTPSGFEKVSDMEYKSDTASYIYSVLSDTTNHEIENRLDSVAVNMENADLGIKGDIYYAAGKTANGYAVTAYRYMAPGESVSAFAGVEYTSDKEVSLDTVTELLSDDYISFTK